MVIRDNVQISRLWRKMTHSGARAFAWVFCAAWLSVGGLTAAPYAQPGQAIQSGHEWAVRPVIMAGLCGDDAEPCPASESRPYVTRPAHAPRWEPEPAPYAYEGRTVIHAKPDCVEERPIVRTRIVQETVAPERSPETYEEPCGIRCWYKRLRAGYCGRGCDYYRFRMTQFPEGRLGADRVRVACR